jgi:hypothetical protein
MRLQSCTFGNSSPSPSPTAELITTPSSSSDKRFSRGRRRKNTLDEQIDKALLSILLSPSRLLKFGNVCRGQESIFGEPNSVERKKVRNRRDYLLNLQQEDPEAFLELAKGFGFLLESDSQEQASPQSSQGEEPDFAQTSIPLITPTTLLPFVPQTTSMPSNSIVLHGTARSKMSMYYWCCCYCYYSSVTACSPPALPLVPLRLA